MDEVKISETSDQWWTFEIISLSEGGSQAWDRELSQDRLGCELSKSYFGLTLDCCRTLWFKFCRHVGHHFFK